ncbi:MAG: GTPase ObgE [Thermodesulfobacteriota bacterium]
MHFVDEAQIRVISGKGGDGCVSFRREKYVPKGGPDGGQGGKGGDVYLQACESLLTLYDFRWKKIFQAQSGRPGQGKNKTGQDGEDLYIQVPLGTQAYEIDEDYGQMLVADLVDPGQTVLLARGGRGGKGNTHFKSSTQRTPRFAQPGEPAEEKQITLQLKLMADVGLLGLPNAGKSTFISKVSAAKPKIAAYPFSTLSPNLGVIKDIQGRSMTLADIPGLIQNSHQGQGLGARFLRHVSRSRALLHILSIEDVSLQDPWAGFGLLNQELEAFDQNLLQKRQIQAINKIDLWPRRDVERLREMARSQDKEVYFISALEGIGVQEVLEVLWGLVLE